MKRLQRNHFLYILCAIAICSIVSACGGGSSGDDIQLTDISIFVDDGFKKPLVDQTFQLDASAIYSGTVANEAITSKANWTTSNPEVATVTSTGEVTTITPGEVTITASYLGVSHGVRLTVSLPPVIKSFSFEEIEDGYNVVEDKSLHLVTLTKYANSTDEQIIQDNSLFDWASADESIATVDETGRVIGISYGEVIITATVKDNTDITGELTITVKPKVVGISTDREETFIEIGENNRLIVNEVLSDGSSRPIPTLVRWVYDSDDVVRIGSTGVMTPESLGIVVAKARYFDFELEHKIIIENPIELFVLEDTGGFIKLKWNEKHNAAFYNINWNNGEEGEEDKIVTLDSDTFEYIQNDVDPNKPYYFRLSFKRELENPTELMIETETENSLNKLSWNATCDATEYFLYWKIDEEGEEENVIKIDAPQIEEETCDNPPLIEYIHENLEVERPHKYRLAYQGKLLTQSDEVQVWAHIGEWTFRNNIEPRVNSAGAAYNEKMYLFGGEVILPPDPNIAESTTTLAPANNEVWEFNILKNRWILRTRLNNALTHATACALDEFIFVIGGIDDNNNVQNSIHVYNAIQGNWEFDKTVFPADATLSNVACAINNNILYITGGYDGNEAVATLYAYNIEDNSWDETFPAFNTARHSHAMAVLDDKIYLVGGAIEGNLATSEIEMLDLNAETLAWSPLNQLEFPRSNFSIHHWNGTIHAVGGIDNTGTLTDKIFSYAAEDDSWQTSATMPFASAAFNSARYDNAIYFWGGSLNSQEHAKGQSNFMKFSLNDGSWLHDASTDSIRRDFDAVMIDEKLYAIGGKDLNGATPSVRVYDTQNNSWKPRSALNTGRFGASAVAYKLNVSDDEIIQRIYVLGGRDINGAYLSDIEMYSVKENIWETKLETMSEGRAFAAAALFDSKIYVFGGEKVGAGQSSPTPIKTYEVFNLKDNTWKQLNNMPRARTGAVAVTLNNKIYIMGGKIDEVKSSLVDVYIPSTDSWEDSHSMNIERVNPGATVFNGRIHVFGGLGGPELKALQSAEVYSPIQREGIPLPNLPRASKTARGGSFQNKIYLLNEEGDFPDTIYNRIFVFE